MHGQDSERSVSLPPCLLFSTGSTDCVCFATVGINDPVTSTLHIIIGNLHFFKSNKKVHNHCNAVMSANGTVLPN